MIAEEEERREGTEELWTVALENRDCDCSDDYSDCENREMEEEDEA